MMALTDFADQAVILPIFAAVALFLLWQRHWFVMATWVVSVATVLGTILVLKILFSTCGWLWPALGADGVDLHSPSGHTAAAAVTYGGVVVLLAARSRRSAIGVALAASFVVAAIIGMTRIGLRVHSLSEVLLAAVIGISGTLMFACIAGRHATMRHPRPILVGVAIIALALHGQHLPAEAVIQGRGVTLLRNLITACDPLQNTTSVRAAWAGSKTGGDAGDAGLERSEPSGPCPLPESSPVGRCVRS